MVTQELESRCAKIEDFLQERFNWRNYEKPTPKKKSEPPPARAEKKSDRFNYMVNMAEKPQDPGTVNELCMEREQKAKARALKAIKNPTTVCQLEKYTELNSNPVKLVPLSTLENGKIMAHMENQIQLLENQQYTRKDDLTQRYVYLYDQERKLQTGGQASKTSVSRHRYNLSHDNRPRTTKHSEMESGLSGFALPTADLATKMEQGARNRLLDNVNEKVLQHELQAMSDFARGQKDGMLTYQTALGYSAGPRLLFNKPGRTVLQHDRLPLSVAGTVKAGLDQDVLSATDRYQQNR